LSERSKGSCSPSGLRRASGDTRTDLGFIGGGEVVVAALERPLPHSPARARQVVADSPAADHAGSLRSSEGCLRATGFSRLPVRRRGEAETSPLQQRGERGSARTRGENAGKGGRYFDYQRPATAGNGATKALEEEALREREAGQTVSASVG
jgi:hypothetical protein